MFKIGFEKISGPVGNKINDLVRTRGLSLKTNARMRSDMAKQIVAARNTHRQANKSLYGRAHKFFTGRQVAGKSTTPVMVGAQKGFELPGSSSDRQYFIHEINAEIPKSGTPKNVGSSSEMYNRYGKRMVTTKDGKIMSNEGGFRTVMYDPKSTN